MFNNNIRVGFDNVIPCSILELRWADTDRVWISDSAILDDSVEPWGGGYDSARICRIQDKIASYNKDFARRRENSGRRHDKDSRE